MRRVIARLCAIVSSIIIWGFCDAFNLNEDKVTIFSAPSYQGEGSYFGYSTAFYFDGADTSVLISATRGNYSKYEAVSPGVLFKCDYQSPDKTCLEIPLEEPGSQKKERSDTESGKVYKDDGTNHMWLGVSLDTQTKSPWDIIVCGHRWASRDNNYNQNERINFNKDFPAMVGVCYRIPARSMSAKGTSTAKIESQKLLPLYKYKTVSSSSVWAGVGLAGMSCGYSDNQDLYLGAPGVYYFSGGAVSYEKRDFGDLIEPSLDIDERFNSINGKTYEFMDGVAGYSMATGYFFKSDELIVALGAPKAGKVKGQVLLAEISRQGRFNPLGKSLDIITSIDGDQLGSYFGGALLSYKLVESTSLNWLVVGAPLWSKKSGGDEGRVYVYTSDVAASKMMRLTGSILTGRGIPKARFGSALASVGDLNLDGFNDIAIGAPYENDHGTVYIYHGSKEGIQRNYAQVIEGRKHGNLAMGFGVNIARSLDIDKNGYQDLLVGAYASDTAFLYRSHPIVQLHGSMNFSINNINRDSKRTCTLDGEEKLCFQVSACFQAIGKYLPATLRISIKLVVDPADQGGYVYERGIFSSKSKTTTEELVLTGFNKMCVNKDVYIIEHDNQDYVNPVKFVAKPTLVDPIQEGKSEFCAQCPIEDPNFQTEIKGKIPFATGCGDDNICECDLSIESSPDLELIMGQNNSILITADIKNEGEPAFIAKVMFIIPAFVKAYAKEFGVCSTRADTNLILGEEESIVECIVGNPLLRGKNVNIPVYLDISSLPNTQRFLEILMEVDSSSDEISPEDCSTTLHVEFSHVASLDIVGYARDSLTVFTGSEKTLPVNHKYKVTKYGPTAVNRVEITISIPITDTKTGIKFVNVNSVDISSDTRVRGSCATIESSYLRDDKDSNNQAKENDGTEFDLGGGRDIPSDFDLTTTTDDHTVDDKPYKLGSHFQLDCASSKCLIVKCIAGPFNYDGDEVTIDITADMDMNAINITRGLTRNMTYVTYGEVENLDSEVPFQSSGLPFSKTEDEVILTFVLNAAPPPTPPPKWIIAVSVGAGFLLLALIALGLLRLGFFQRKKHEEMKRQLIQANVIKEEDAQKNLNETPCTTEPQVQNLHQDPDVFKI